MNKSFRLLVAPVAVVAALAFAGCGDDDKDDSTTSVPATPTETSPAPKGGATGEAKGGTTKLDISADASGALKFDTSKLTAKAGEVTIVMDNPSDVPHTVSIEGNGIDEQGTGGKQGVGKGEKSTVTADLKPGKYTFYCPVGGHEQAGMKGTLTVE
jgi:plastocyanin